MLYIFFVCHLRDFEALRGRRILNFDLEGHVGERGTSTEMIDYFYGYHTYARRHTQNRGDGEGVIGQSLCKERELYRFGLVTSAILAQKGKARQRKIGRSWSSYLLFGFW